MGQRITKLKPAGGFCNAAGSAATLFSATGIGIPVSATHTITGAISGVGWVRNASAASWCLTQKIVLVWIDTIPTSDLIAALFYALSLWLF
jgi:inorganic phosphate transporter, PiT family